MEVPLNIKVPPVSFLVLFTHFTCYTSITTFPNPSSYPKSKTGPFWNVSSFINPFLHFLYSSLSVRWDLFLLRDRPLYRLHSRRRCPKCKDFIGGVKGRVHWKSRNGRGWGSSPLQVQGTGPWTYPETLTGLTISYRSYCLPYDTLKVRSNSFRHLEHTLRERTF